MPTIKIGFESDTSGLDKGITDAETKVTGFGEKASKGLLGVAASAAKVIAPTVAIVGVVKKFAGAAGEAAAANNEFDLSLKNAGISAGAADPAMKSAVQNAKDLAFSGKDAKEALSNLALATGDADAAAALLAVSMDIARGADVDLGVAADAVAKATQGQDRALMALLPGLEKGATAQDTLANATAASAGQAEAFGSSTEASMIRAKAALKGIGIQIGNVLVPILKGLGEILGPIIAAFAEFINIVLPPLVPLMQKVGEILGVVGEALSTVLGWAVDLTAGVISLMQTALEPIQGVLSKVGDALGNVRDAVGKLTEGFGGLGEKIGNIMGKIDSLIGKLKDLLNPLDNALSKLRDLNPFSGTIDKILGRSYATGAAGGTYAAVSPFANTTAPTRSAGGITINIYGDPSVIEAKVTKALRDYQRRNGPGAVFAPGRS